MRGDAFQKYGNEKQAEFLFLDLLLPLLLATLPALARDYGQYENVPPATRQWFRDLRSPDGSIRCCDESDCARTEAHIMESRWQARAPDGSWLSIPPTREHSRAYRSARK